MADAPLPQECLEDCLAGALKTVLGQLEAELGRALMDTFTKVFTDEAEGLFNDRPAEWQAGMKFVLDLVRESTTEVLMKKVP